MSLDRRRKGGRRSARKSDPTVSKSSSDREPFERESDASEAASDYSPSSESSDDDFLPSSRTSGASQKQKGKSGNKQSTVSEAKGCNDAEVAGDDGEVGQIEKKNTRKGVTKQKKEEKRLETTAELFRLFDVKGNGIVTVDDVERLADECGLDINREAVQNMVRQYDTTNTNVLLLEDFQRIATDVKL